MAAAEPPEDVPAWLWLPGPTWSTPSTGALLFSLDPAPVTNTVPATLSGAPLNVQWTLMKGHRT